MKKLSKYIAFAFLGMAYFMTILGSFRNIINALNSSTGKYWIRKMDE